MSVQQESAEIGGTKLALILAAGELFAERGMDGTSVRSIAEKAEANIAAINYHFGSKENLYTETLRWVALQQAETRSSSLLREEWRFSTPERIAATVTELIHGKFQFYLGMSGPSWYAKLMMRALTEATPAMQMVAKQVFQPDLEALEQILRRAKPSLSGDQAQFMAFSIVGQIVFYTVAKEPLIALLDKEDYDRAFLDSAIAHVVNLSLEVLGLPVPDGPAPPRPVLLGENTAEEGAE